MKSNTGNSITLYTRRYKEKANLSFQNVNGIALTGTVLVKNKSHLSPEKYKGRKVNTPKKTPTDIPLLLSNPRILAFTATASFK